MNPEHVADALQRFAETNKVRLTNYARRESQLLELGAMLLAVTHYERAGYMVAPFNAAGGEFSVNLSSRGKPWNFSYWQVRRQDEEFFIYTNLAIDSACGTDDGIYVVDVAVTKRAVELPARSADWQSVPNSEVVTFLEAKRLVVYPMLLAQFVGIVHEIKPQFLNGSRPRGFLKSHHFDPALVSIGYIHGRSKSIVHGYVERRFRLTILGNADIAIAKVNRDAKAASPLGRKVGRVGPIDTD